MLITHAISSREPANLRAPIRRVRSRQRPERESVTAEVTLANLPELVSRLGYNIAESVGLPGRQGSFAPVPDRLPAPLERLLTDRFPRGLYRHQGEAIDAVIDGQDVCLATSTASGKSLVFMSAAAHLLERERCARILALYPARALIQDQKSKWESLLLPLGFSVGCIDGSVPVAQRIAVLRASRVVLMTPDVAHAWLLSHVAERPVAAFLGGIRLLVLDEAHVYDGVFGTNMAYFLRRLEYIAHAYQLICCTATLGTPPDYLSSLTGRSPRTFGPDEDSSKTPEKTIYLLHGPALKGFDAAAGLLRELSKSYAGRFLAFGDSRKMVELLVAAARREGTEKAAEDEEEVPPNSHGKYLAKQPLLPYRAGYEPEDRRAIQQALGQGSLRGVVSTSALELGLDIGEIDLVVLLNTPPTAKAFWQRLGRSGRVRPSICLFNDSRGVTGDRNSGLAGYLSRPVEPNWLYLDNRYIQYANALCAAAEIRDSGSARPLEACYSTLPETFAAFLKNELHPSETVPADLYPLKQKAQPSPHREFPIRCGIEQEFAVKGPYGLQLGNLTLSQALREAYPGAIYHYLARPYRVHGIDFHRTEIRAKREKHWTTKPLSQVMVFPNFKTGILSLYRSSYGFLAEVEVQVSERVIGFSEKRGSQEQQHLYSPESEYSQRGLSRFFATTGVCWSFSAPGTPAAAAGQMIAEAFCLEFGVQDRDIGCGNFFAKSSPFSPEESQGVCVYDATNGSLRLTQRLADRFHRVLSAAISVAEGDPNPQSAEELKSLELLALDLQTQQPGGKEEPQLLEPDWRVVIAAGEQGMHVAEEGAQVVTVLGYRYTPQGLLYELKNGKEGCRWLVAETCVQPLLGQTRMQRVNLLTGEEQPIQE